MAVRVTNRTRNVVLLRLKSGLTVHLGARQESDDLEDADVLGNPRIESLVGRRLVAIEPVPARGARAQARPKASRAGTRAGAAAKALGRARAAPSTAASSRRRRGSSAAPGASG